MWTEYLVKARHGAEARGIKFDIDAAYIERLFEEQSGKCAISGLPLRADRVRLNPTASLDRRDSARGYQKGNVQWVHKVVNIMKLNHEQAYFVAMCKQIAANMGGDALTESERRMLAGQPFTSKARPKDPFPKREVVPAPESLLSVGGMLF